MRDLVGGPRRFVELQRTLPGISTEQLRSRLNRMVADGLLTRQRYREVPPRVDYELTERSRALMPVIGALTRWGYQWAWDEPREGEAIDVGAVLRAASGLDPAHGLPSGTVHLIVDHADSCSTYAVSCSAGRLHYDEQPQAGQAQATLRGSLADWVTALGPDAASDALSVSGDQQLAHALLRNLVDERELATVRAA